MLEPHILVFGQSEQVDATKVQQVLKFYLEGLYVINQAGTDSLVVTMLLHAVQCILNLCYKRSYTLNTFEPLKLVYCTCDLVSALFYVMNC